MMCEELVEALRALDVWLELGKGAGDEDDFVCAYCVNGQHGTEPVMTWGQIRAIRARLALETREPVGWQAEDNRGGWHEMSEVEAREAATIKRYWTGRIRPLYAGPPEPEEE